MANSPASDGDSALVSAVVEWFDHHERPLPWRSTTPWGVLVSEFMLQQTPVDRVWPVWQAWLDRWPSPDSLAQASIGDAVRAWGRLGYPRRAKRLHESAVLIRDHHQGVVPRDEAALRQLPGVGDYTAAAVRAFAFGERSIVLDTNVRRVLTRALAGVSMPTPHLTRAERQDADALWPPGDEQSARWSAAVMELGALVCTARAPACERCPISDDCAWLAVGQPSRQTARRQPRYEGSDRQVRGLLLARLRSAAHPVAADDLARLWDDDAQRDRALAGLLADGLVEKSTRGTYRLPGG